MVRLLRNESLLTASIYDARLESGGVRRNSFPVTQRVSRRPRLNWILLGKSVRPTSDNKHDSPHTSVLFRLLQVLIFYIPSFTEQERTKRTTQTSKMPRRTMERSKPRETEEEEILIDEEPPAVNPYEILGIDDEATGEQVKSAYRKQALKHHPGTTPHFPRSQFLPIAYP